MRALRIAGLILLALLHQDTWLWDDARIVLGLPVGLTYHIGLCVAASLLFLSMTRSELPDEGEEAPS